MNRVDADVALEVASHEAIVRQAYRDSVKKWTWSVGLTNACGHDVTRYIGKPQPLEHCLAVFAWALEKYADEVREAFAGHKLTKAQFAAALSFHWNTGGIKRASWVKHFKAGQMAKARKAFMDWRKPPEVVPRREKERDLFFDGKWSNDGTITEYTRLTVSSTPVWASAKKIHVREALRKALGEAHSAAPVADKPVPAPKPRKDNTRAPDAPVTPQGNSPLKAIIALVIAACVALAGWLGWGG